MQKVFMRAALVAIASLASLTSHADATEQATISNIKIRLVDLDPNDGIAPGITFAAGGYFSISPTSLGAGEEIMQSNFALGASISTTRTLGGHSVSLTVLPGDILGSGSGPGAMVSHSGSGAGGLGGDAEVISTSFTLTPNTRIEISAFASATSAGYLGGGAEFSTWAGAGLTIYGNVSGTTFGFDYINASTGSNGQSFTDPARELFAFYDNMTDSSFSANINAVAYAGALQAGAVPEPSTFALLAAGAMMLATRRRKA